MRPFLKILIILSTQVSTYLHSQNLVNNGSFEHLVDCFDRCGEWFEYQPNLIAKYWTSATTGDPDVFSPCNYGVAGNYICTPYYVPKNIYGFQFAKEGQNYAGFAAGASYLSNPQSYSQFAYEYLSNNLIQQLENKKYCITLSVSIASGYEPQFPNITNSSLYAFLALRQLEIFFTKEKFFVPIAFEKLNNRFDVTFKSERDTFFRDTLNWETLSMPYLARGDERFMTIGNFSPDTQKYHFETNMSQAQLDSFSHAVASSYLYIDDISLVEIPELEAKADTNTVYKGTRAWLYSPTQAEEYTWFTGDTLHSIGNGDSLRVNPTETTTYWLKALPCKLTTYDTVTITVLPAPLIPVNVSVVNTLTNSEFTIKYIGDNRPELQAELFNSVGQIVRRFVFTDTMNVGISDLAAGIYYCRIRKENVPVLTQKIVRVR